MGRPTIASLTEEVEYQKGRVTQADKNRIAADEARRTAEKVAEGLRDEIAGLRSLLADAERAAAYWLGRAHQAVGIDEAQQGRPIAELVTFTSPPSEPWRFR